MNNIQRDFNTIAKVLLGLSIFPVIMAIINSLISISNNEYFGVNNCSLVIEIICDCLILTAVGLTFMKKRYGLIALTVLFIVRMFATIPIGGNIAYSYQLGGNMVLLLRDFGLFAIAMCFKSKRTHMSGWKSMLASAKSMSNELPKNDEVEKEGTNSNELEKEEKEGLPLLQRCEDFECIQPGEGNGNSQSGINNNDLEPVKQFEDQADISEKLPISNVYEDSKQKHKVCNSIRQLFCGVDKKQITKIVILSVIGIGILAFALLGQDSKDDEEYYDKSARAQTVIQMIEDMGIYKVPCEVNGLKVKMIFDTGAAVVSISQSLAEMMVDNGYISKSDIVGQAKSMTADGRIVNHTNIILKTIKIGDITLNNVKAVVINKQTTPLLFGQSAIQLLGEVSIKGDKLYIKSGSGSANSSTSFNTHFEKWDAKNYVYTNYTYGFGWNLPKGNEWERVEGYEKHTPFRAECAPFVVFVNAQIHDNGGDLWQVFDKFSAMIEQRDAAMEKKTGQLNYERTFEKCTLFGQHAIKTTFKEYFKDSRFNEAVENYAEEYFVIWNGYTLIIAVKLPKAVYDAYDCSEAISEIFKGFRISVIH